MTVLKLYIALMCVSMAYAIIARFGIPKDWDNQTGTLGRLSDVGYYPAVFTLLGCALLSMTPLERHIPIILIAPSVFVLYQSIAIMGARPRTTGEKT